MHIRIYTTETERQYIFCINFIHYTRDDSHDLIGKDGERNHCGRSYKNKRNKNNRKNVWVLGGMEVWRQTARRLH